MIKILWAQLAELKEKNALKEREMMDIEKWKASTLEEVSQVKNTFAASVSFHFCIIFSYIY